MRKLKKLVSVSLQIREQKLEQILMSVQRGSLRVTAILAVLTSRGGTTVSAEAVSMTMEAILLPGSPVWVSILREPFFSSFCMAFPRDWGVPEQGSGTEVSVCLSAPPARRGIPSLTHCSAPFSRAKGWETWNIDECALKIHTCWNDSACVNLPGGFDCLCPSGPSCTGDCPHEGGFKRNGQVWTLREDRCSVCSCKVFNLSSAALSACLEKPGLVPMEVRSTAVVLGVPQDEPRALGWAVADGGPCVLQDGRIFCRRTACDCGSPSADLFCCPECDTRVTSQCLHQSGQRLYRSGDNWTYSCQHCRCLEGEVDCWPLQCPTLSCEYTAISEGECCPHCVSDPCLADNITYDIRKTCPDGYGITRLSGAVWTMVGSPCTTCKCKVWWARWNGRGMYLIKSGSFSSPGGSHEDLGESTQKPQPQLKEHFMEENNSLCDQDNNVLQNKRKEPDPGHWENETEQDWDPKPALPISFHSQGEEKKLYFMERNEAMS
ncbi:hypothetical protein EK904_012486 [Melospiza melodia maxima]|nr:hypothetical protein EK904_012486 [Melospiza melodia maxima]